MHKIIVINNKTNKEYICIKETEQEIQNWLNKHINNSTFGKPERWVKDSLDNPLTQLEKNTALDSREIIDEITQESHMEYKLECEYSISQEESNNNYFNLQDAYDKLRKERDIILKSLDFTQLPDAPISSEERAKYKEYRTYLRGLPSAYNDSNITSYSILSFEDWKLQNQ